MSTNRTQTHAPTPWRAECYPREHLIRIEGPSHENIVAEIPSGACRPYSREATALRIVACVNACEGINPDAVPGLLAACERAARWIESEYDGEACDVLEGLLSASAKAKGTT